MDIVTDQYVNENTRIYYDPSHKWYYFRELQEDEIVVFVQADSAARDRAGVPHTSFEDPAAPHAKPRESIEARVFVYLDE